MNTMPIKMKAGMALGILGGMIALVAMAASWTGDIDSMPLVGVNMLIAVMFFAAAGTFTGYSPVSGNTSVVISALAAAVIIIGMLYASTELWISAIMLIVSVGCILVAACPNVTHWIDSNRVA